MANEYYRFISFDGRDANQLQAYLRVINNAIYLKYTYINPADLDWVESIEAGDRVGFFQNDADRATANILAPYDTENGFRLEEAPQPDLIEGQYYEIRYSRPRPADQIPTPPENRGWSPLYGLEYLNFDGTTYTVSNTATPIFAFKVTDWTSGQGQKPQLGYIGVNGLVGDVNNAAILRLPPGPAGESTQWTEGTAFPASPNNNDFHLFTENVTGLTNYFQADGTTARAAATAGEVAQYKTDKWVFVMRLGTSAGGRAFTDTLDLGTWENANGGAIAGHYVRESDTRVDISYRNIANEDKTTEIRAIPVGYGLKFGDKIFVIEWTNEQSSYREFNGFWAAGEADTTAESSQISIKVIQHELRMIRFVTEKQVYELIPDLQRAIEKTTDIHIEDRPGDFSNLTDAAVGGIAIIENTSANRASLSARNFNFAGLTWNNPSVDIPDDGQDYYVVVRLAKSLGHIEPEIRLLSNDPEASYEHLYRSRQDDTNWYYYQAVADRESIWTLQRRATATHTSWFGRLGGAALTQIQGLIDTAINGIRNRLLPDPSGSTAGYVAKVNAELNGYELAPDQRGSGGTGGGLDTQQVTAIANARAEARFTDEEKTKLANAIIASDLDPYGLGFIGIYPRYMRFDQLAENIIIAFGEVHEPYDEANLIQITINGTRVVRDSFSPNGKFYKFTIVNSNVDNILSNTQANTEYWECSIRLYKDGYLAENEIGHPRTIPIVINRDPAPATPTGDGKVIYTSGRPADDAGKVGDTAFRNLTDRISIYEKIAAETWSYKYDIPKRFTAEYIYNLIAEERTRYLKLGINTGLTIALANAATPTTLTFAATALQSNENTGHITRATAGDGIDLKAGTYRIWTRVSMATPATNARSSLDVSVYDVTNTTELDKDENCGYIRSLDFLPTESVLARNTITIATDTKIAVRAQLGTVQGGSGTALTITTDVGGYVYIEKL